MVVVVGRIGEDTVEYGLRHLALHLRQEVLIVGEGLLFGIGEAVETHVLQGAAARAGGESVVHCRLSGYLSPLCEGVVLRTVDGHTALIELLSVA